MMQLEIANPVKTKPVRGFEGIYEVTEYGQVWSIARRVKRPGTGPMKVGGKWMEPSTIKGGYKRYNLRKNGKNKHILAHRIVFESFNETSLGDLHVDHIDRNPRNNHTSNLRSATPSENRRNCIGKPNRRKAKYKGIHKWGNKWRAKCGRVDLGLHTTQEEAAMAYDKSAREQYGDYAHTNF